MKRFTAVALLVAGMTLPAWGQRGGGRGGGSGHAMAPARGGFSMGSRSSYAGGRSGIGMIGSGYSRGAPGLRAGVGYPIRRSVYGYGAGYGAPRRYRTPYVPIPYGYSAGWIGPDYFGYPDVPVDDGSAYNGAAAQPYYPDYPDNDSGAYGTAPAQQAVAPADSYRPAYRAVEPEPAKDEPVTLIFKDGHPSEQIHNYILTRTTLFVQDGRPRDIPVAQLDLAATEKVNHDAGVDFKLP